MPPFVFCRITKNWIDFWKPYNYKNIPLVEMLNKPLFKRIAFDLGVRIPQQYYHGYFNECPRFLLSQPKIIIKKMEGKGQENNKPLVWLENQWGREKVMIEEHIKHFKGDYKIPFDYKVYMFKGDAHYILIINRNKGPRKASKKEESHLLLDRECKDVTYLLGGKKHHGCAVPTIENKDEAIPSKDVWNKLILTAEYLGKEIFKDVFVRLDFFIDNRGPVLCELSPSPRGHWFWWFHQSRYGDKQNKEVWEKSPDKERVLDRLCMKYKIKPQWLV